jgi:hypothetical protein
VLPVIVKLFDRFFRKIIGIVLFDPRTSTLMPALGGRRGGAVIISRVLLGASCRWVGRTCHMERPSVRRR